MCINIYTAFEYSCDKSMYSIADTILVQRIQNSTIALKFTVLQQAQEFVFCLLDFRKSSCYPQRIHP